MAKIPKTEVDLSLWQFDVDTPQFLKEAALNCKGGIYVVCWECFRMLLAQVAQRATELNDPVLNVLMLRLNLYEVPNDQRRREARKQIVKYVKEIEK